MNEILYLDPDFQLTFVHQEHLFDQMMAIQGQVLRALEGRKTVRFLHQGQYYYIKQHFGVGWKEIIKNLLQFKWPVLGAKTEWKAIQDFQRLNLPTLTCVGFGERGINPAKKQSFLITRELTGVISLEDFCACWASSPPRFELKKALIQQVAQMARVLHSHGMNHRDFYLCHFLLKEESLSAIEGNELPILYLIDLHRVQKRKKIPFRWRVKDIAGLYFSSMDIHLTRRDGYRFLKYYFGQSLRETFRGQKNFLLEVETRAKKLYFKSFHRYPEMLSRKKVGQHGH